MEFIQPHEANTNEKPLSSVAMNFNGMYFEEEIEGYETINVSGREMISCDMNYQRREHGDGAIRYGKTKPPRYIGVQYKITANTAQELQEKFNQLRRLLHTEDVVPIHFRDEPGVTYYGEYESTDDVPENQLTFFSRFTLFCPDPDKRRNTVTTDGEVEIDTFYTTIPKRILVTVSETTNRVQVTNGEQTISLTGEFNAGTEIEINPKEQDVHVNGVERWDVIDLHSDFENFVIQNGQTVTTEQGELEIEMREVV